MKRKIVAKKLNKRLLSFGFEDTSRFAPVEYDIVETSLEKLPDEMRFCIYENGEVVVDKAYKAQVLQEEAEREQKRVSARQYIKNNDPADANSVPALRERVKRLEVLLGIYKWI